ncbi:hypothetical protein KM873_04310 [Bacillus subtilis]|nr:hypothetical protein [Bacillus subtilis]MXV43275.1 hypothetical protein [Bacillus subtilis]
MNFNFNKKTLKGTLPIKVKQLSLDYSKATY